MDPQQSAATRTGGEIKEMIQTATRLIADMKFELTRSFNSVLSQMLAGMCRIMPDKRTQLDIWKAVVDDVKGTDMHILSMIEFLQADGQHAKWAMEHDTLLFSSASQNKTVVNGDVAIMFGTLAERFATFTDKTKQNVWSFVELLTTYAIKYCELIGTPPEAVEAGLAQAMQAMPKWQDEFVQRNGRQPTLLEVQQFSANLLTGQTQ
jgi:hypothetical protein